MFFIHTYTKLRKKRDLIVTELRDTVIQSLETADLGEISVNLRIILKLIVKEQNLCVCVCEGGDWIQSSHNTAHCQTFDNTVMNFLLVP